MLGHLKFQLFLERIVIGDEKWILYNTIESKSQWSKQNLPLFPMPKTNLPQKKVYAHYLKEF